ncbi:MAG: hypothetical protein ACFWTZ_06680 [Burkholderia sp.]
MQRHRVVALHERVKQLVHGNGRLLGEALGEVVALEKARERVARGELDEAHGAELDAPLGVVADLGAVEVKDLAGLREVGLGVGDDLLVRERRARHVAARGIADAGGEVAHEEDDRVAEVLELAQLVEHHGVAEMDVGSRRVEAELAAQGLARRLGAGELLHEFLLDQEGIRAAADRGHGFADVIGHRVGLFAPAAFLFDCHRFSLSQKLRPPLRRPTVRQKSPKPRAVRPAAPSKRRAWACNVLQRISRRARGLSALK